MDAGSSHWSVRTRKTESGDGCGWIDFEAVDYTDYAIKNFVIDYRCAGNELDREGAGKADARAESRRRRYESDAAAFAA